MNKSSFQWILALFVCLGLTGCYEDTPKEHLLPVSGGGGTGSGSGGKSGGKSGATSVFGKANSCESDGTYDGSDFSGVIGGDLVRPNSWVARRTVFIYDSSTQSMCTGTLIDRDVVLTAAHCVDMATSAKSIAVFFTSRPQCELEAGNLVTKSIVASDFAVHPSWMKQEEEVNGDLALIKLSQNAPDYMEVTKLKISTTPVTSFERVLVAGYGNTVGGEKRDTAPVALRALERKPLTGENLEMVKDKLYEFTFNEYPREVVAPLMDLLFDMSPTAEMMWLDQTDERGVCSGDSGGPAFAIENGNIVQIGVTSSVLQYTPEKKCLVTSAYTKVEYHLGWIGQTYTQLTGRRFSTVTRD